jgi:hypothetical protein
MTIKITNPLPSEDDPELYPPELLLKPPPLPGIKIGAIIVFPPCLGWLG